MSFTIKNRHGARNMTPRGNASVRYIVVHNTGTAPHAAPAADNNCTYFNNAYRGASAHYFIDDSTICEYADPAKQITWHCGDGRGRYGITNANSVGVEVCNNGTFTDAELERLRFLVHYLMEKFGVPASRVVRHYDASRKRCPAAYIDATAWDTLHTYITGGNAEKPVADGTVPQRVRQIAVDGYWGSATTKRLQEYFGTTPDGIVSGQYRGNKQPAMTTGWDFSNTKAGSNAIRKVQRATGAAVDGHFGVNSVKALEKHFGYNPDGRLDSPSLTVKAMQKALNENRF